MPVPPPRRPLPRPSPSAAEREREPAPANPTTPSFMTFGGQAKAQARASAEPSFVPEFFITKAEVAAAKAKGEPGVTVRVHFMRNYAKEAENIVVPRVSVMEAGNWKSYTSAGDDCAIVQAGVRPQMKPVYVLADHRMILDKQTNQKVCDRIRLFIAPSIFVGLMDSAVKNLAENLGVDPSTIDITKYEARLTKIGEGRSSSWSLDFAVQPKALSQTALNNYAKTFKDGYIETLTKWLAPSDRYLISKGGRYIKPARNANDAAQGGGDGGDEPPY